MDTRAARRAAEKAAKDLITSRAALVGELGVAQAERTQLTDDVAAAAQRSRQLITAAQAEAHQLVDAAQARVADADQRYTQAYTAATTAHWALADLTALGFQPTPAPPTRRRRTTPDPSGPGNPPTPSTTDPANATTTAVDAHDDAATAA